MATVTPIAGDWPEITVTIHTDGRLSVGNVGNFLQRLDTASRYVGRRASLTPRIELVELSTSSIKVKYKAIGLAISAAALAVGVAQYFKENPAAVRAGNDIIAKDNGTHITVQGGTANITLGPDQLQQWQGVLAESAASKAIPENPPRDFVTKVIRGPHIGTLKRIDGQHWVQLDERPGLILEVRDERADATLLDANLRYRFEGDAIISGSGAESRFVLRGAMKL